MAPQTRYHSNNTKGNSSNEARPWNISLEAILERLITAQAKMEKCMEQQLKNQAEYQTHMLNALREFAPQDNNARAPPCENDVPEQNGNI